MTECNEATTLVAMMRQQVCGELVTLRNGASNRQGVAGRAER